MEIGTLEFVMQSARAVMASLALSYEVETGNSFAEDELKCMAENIYFEGRAEPMMGKVAIGKVVMNRIDSDRHPNTVCGVVHEGPHRESWKTRGKDVPDEDRKFFPLRNKCDFSWYCDGKPDIPEDSKTWEECLKLANMIMDEGMFDFTHGSTHYHNDQVDPYWNKHLKKTLVIDNHIFYK